jgi:hypothetical protein
VFDPTYGPNLNDNGYRNTSTRGSFAPVVNATSAPVAPATAPKATPKRKAGAKRLRDIERREYVTVDEDNEAAPDIELHESSATVSIY